MLIFEKGIGVIEKTYRKEELEKTYRINDTANMLSKELLYMKFLQGIPIVGVVGGAYDAIYMKLITEYAELKYRRRFLLKKRKQC